MELLCPSLWMSACASSTASCDLKSPKLGFPELSAVVVSDATEAKLLQLELALNRLPEDSTWDAANLKIKIEQLIEYNVDLTFTGFETAEIDNILSFEVIEPDDQDWTVRSCHPLR